MSEDDVRPCHHCSAPVGDSPYFVVLEGMASDHALPLCRSCQSLRQAGQLPVDLLVQQWSYAHSGATAGHSGEPDEILVRLDCLGCGGSLSQLDRPGASGSVDAPQARRLPDGSLTTECLDCQRTNVLERRGWQMVAVRLW
ncbi:MAG: hypothetical protein ABIP29_10345 [Candidatus Eisenbacteria bacterium]